MKRTFSILMAGLLAAGLALTGCSDKDDDAVPDQAERPGQAISNAAETGAAATQGAADATGNAAITAKVKTAFGADATVPAMAINVDTSGDGVVTLTGEVETAAAKTKAEEIAKGIDGVKSVVNNLTVKSGG